MILVLGKSALSVPDTRFSRVSGSTLVFTLMQPSVHTDKGTPVVAFSQTELSGSLNAFYLDWNLPIRM